MIRFVLLLAAFAGYRQVVPGYRFQFPRDHFDHPEFRTEWWYYTGNLRANNGHRYGFELVFFRQGQHRGESSNRSTWRIDDLYLAHLALTDIDGHRFATFRRLNRAGPEIAGISMEPPRIWNGNWEAKWDLSSDVQRLSAVASGVSLSLSLTPLKPPVIHGENGINRKGASEANASYYVSFPRLAVEGIIDGIPVDGTAWMDHEWFSNSLDASEVGWDWFSIQLDDNTELMLCELRHADGSIDPNSAGTYIDAQGRPTHLKLADFLLRPESFWTSAKTHGRYPIRWRIEVPSLGIQLDCAAALDNQELVSEGVGPTYWEGAVTYSGSATGRGYLEMTGYAGESGRGFHWF